ncbi:MAG: DUF6602 domain-containing protein [Terracidiphilus sp.]
MRNKTKLTKNIRGTQASVWSLTRMMDGLHQRVERELRLARETVGHNPTLGESSQRVWIRLLETYLPERYRARSATVMDSEGNFSDQIDVVIFDRQYSPLLFEFEGAVVVPVEAVYAVFESKQELLGHFVAYAQKKVASVRRLKRTSVTIPTINGSFKKEPQWILGGFLALEAVYRKSLEGVLVERLKEEQGKGRLDLGCVASLGTFGCGGASSTEVRFDTKAATSFLFELMTRLQECGTAPAISFRAYAKWLAPA